MNVPLHFIVRVPNAGTAVPLSDVDEYVETFSLVALRANITAFKTGT